MSTATVTRRLRVIPRIRLSTGRVVALLVIAAILFFGWRWLRSSSLVAVRQVEVHGLSGADAAQVRGALVDSALTMTTLDASTAKLESAVSAFPDIAGITIATHFPHAITIDVDEQIPVATAEDGGQIVDVDAAGQALYSAHVAGLPTVASVTARGPLAVLGAAPYQLLGHIESAVNNNAHGVIVQLRDGPELYFGSVTALAAKWRGVVAVLANSDSSGAGYIDVTDPGRPAAGP